MRVRFSSSLVAILLTAAAPAAAQTVEDLFSPDSVQEIRLSVNSRDLATLRAHTELKPHYGRLTWRIKVRNVGIGRGRAAIQPSRASASTWRTTTGQTFVGLSIVLDNIWQTRRSCAISRLHIREGGPPAPRIVRRLFVTNEPRACDHRGSTATSRSA